MGREVLAIFIMCSRDIEQTVSTSFVDVVLGYLDTLYKIPIFGFPFSIFQFLFIRFIVKVAWIVICPAVHPVRIFDLARSQRSSLVTPFLCEAERGTGTNQAMGMDAAARLRVSYLAIIYTIIALFCLPFFCSQLNSAVRMVSVPEEVGN